ncbi:FAD-dependent oxidoreductase [Primorskyibacter aestuariivivens]|uniref:NAD(P)/FAD-dependent oxidoreductase n=1 Tax=Primorskyibacter aestuariivivens TaxID=1888912 RepID=UPI002300C17D|nr:FAD-dependent oxidoreductase [Primorskyibacter aestuariivivens]MDA7429662.1 FAD-dependent oxidoreductase [Primorskyibacter aestuariivivens]
MTIVVIGRGLIGSAAARHLAMSGQDVVLLGPSEPGDKANHDGVFGSHYDEGRITRGLDPWPFWSRASRASIARYGEIAQTSGIGFFTERGLVMAGPDGSAPITRVADVASAAGIDCTHLRGDALAQRFPFFDFPADTLAIHEPSNAGFISPRRLVAAQTKAAEAHGARVVDAFTTGLTETGAGVTIRTPSGDVHGDQILVAAGGFSNMVLPEPLPLNVYARTVALFEVDETEAARLADMPPLIYLLPSGEDPYLLPPIRYPDGRMWLKLGGDPEDIALPDRQATQDWFRAGGSQQVAEKLEDVIHERMPGLRVTSRAKAACVTTYTAENIPRIARISDRVSVAVGGCGRGAKCSDELGRLGAEVTLGRTLPDWALEPAVA